jgi:DNA-binding HxlR family transcriptional regulator
VAKRNSLAHDRRNSVDESADAPLASSRSSSGAERASRSASGKPRGSGARHAQGGGAVLEPVSGTGGDATPASLDRLIHERIRLGIVSALAVNAHLSFNALKALMGTTDGNLSVHARKLEEAGYVSCTKSFEGRVPKTDYALTAAGRRALERYLGHMEAIIKATRER